MMDRKYDSRRLSKVIPNQNEREGANTDCTTAQNIMTIQEIKNELNAMGAYVMEPEGEMEERMAEAFEAFTLFILEQEQEKCQAIIENHIGSSVGELAGGSNQHSIYRVLITDDDDEDYHHEAAVELIKEFHSSQQGKCYTNVLSIQKLRQYMLGMCEKRSEIYDIYDSAGNYCNKSNNKYSKLGNFMFILSFGAINGQVRHIDNMAGNLQICLYMSSGCPSTILYAMDGLPITNYQELIERWETDEYFIGTVSGQLQVPGLVKRILRERGDAALKKWYLKYFSFWGTINEHLCVFGKLYQPVSRQFSLTVDPGTTLLAGGNEVHAGPPASQARMFAFAVGVPEEDNELNKQEHYTKFENNNGEVQYSPVLLHVDLCSILFSMIDFEYGGQEDEHNEAKIFLLSILPRLARDYPKETYARQLDDDRMEVRDWLGRLVNSLESDPEKLNRLVEQAAESDTMFYSPDVQKRRKKKKKRRNPKDSFE